MPFAERGEHLFGRREVDIEAATLVELGNGGRVAHPVARIDIGQPDMARKRRPDGAVRQRDLCLLQGHSCRIECGLSRFDLAFGYCARIFDPPVSPEQLLRFAHLDARGIHGEPFLPRIQFQQRLARLHIVAGGKHHAGYAACRFGKKLGGCNGPRSADCLDPGLLRQQANRFGHHRDRLFRTFCALWRTACKKYPAQKAERSNYGTHAAWRNQCGHIAKALIRSGLYLVPIR